MYDPGSTNDLDATAPAMSSNCPSLSVSHASLIGPSGSAEVEEKVTVSPVNGLSGAMLKDAWGGALTVSVAGSTSLPPPVSVTLTATLFTPGLEKACPAVAPVASGV